MSATDDRITACIAAGRSFLLDAGAGAGKTSSLVVTLRNATKSLGQGMARRGQQIACITYTNVAKDEIVERSGRSELIRVSTIHDFLWSVIRGHQRALRRAVLQVNSGLPAESRRRKDPLQLAEALPNLAIAYSDMGSDFLDGRIFHDDLIDIAQVMFSANPVLSRLVAARYPYILVDEYQDASPLVIELLVNQVLAHNPGSMLVGLFGDKLQHIYDSGVGELPTAVLGKLERIIKADNYRCSVAVIDLLNRLRTDITQVPGERNLPGMAIYVHVRAPDESAVQRVRSMMAEKHGWTTGDGTERELYLTHRLIARKGGYDGLIDAYDKRGSMFRERLLSGEDPRIAFFLNVVEPLATAWTERRVGAALSLLRSGGFVLAPGRTKATTTAALDQLNALREKDSVEGVLRHLQDAGLTKLPDDLRGRLADKTQFTADTPEAKEREERDAAFYSALFALQYAQVAAFAEFFLQHTPYSTKHGVKGAEFDTVYVVLDDRGARWNIYSFDKYLTGEDRTRNVERFSRSKNVFYVCCSRARKNLAVVDLGATNAEKQAAVEALFGKEHCCSI